MSIIKFIISFLLSLLPVAVLIRDWKFHDKRTIKHHNITRIIIILWCIGSFFAVYFVWSDSTKIEELISGKNTLISQNQELSIKIDNYQNDLKVKDNKIEALESEINTLSLTAPKLRPDGRIVASQYVSYASEYSDGIDKARKLFIDGELKESYETAKLLSEKNPKLGLSYFLMGTIEIENGNYPVGDKYLKNAIDLGLTKEDEAQAYHNLGVSASRQNNISEAIFFLKKSLNLDPSKEDSKTFLDSLERNKN